MQRSRLGAIVIDCQDADLDQAASFWGGALGLESHRYSDPADAHYASLVTAQGEPEIVLQKVDHPSRVHLDIETDDVEAEVARLEQLGAREHERVRDWVVMEAPTGHRFCVVPIEREGNTGD